MIYVTPIDGFDYANTPAEVRTVQASNEVFLLSSDRDLLVVGTIPYGLWHNVLYLWCRLLAAPNRSELRELRRMFEVWAKEHAALTLRANGNINERFATFFGFRRAPLAFGADAYEWRAPK